MAKKSANEGGWKRTNITPAVMREYAAAMHKIATQHEKLADLMQESGISSVDARGLKQTLEGYTRIASFLGSVFQSLTENELARGVGGMLDAIRDIRLLTNRLPKDDSPPVFTNAAREEEIDATVKQAVEANHKSNPRKK